MPHCSLELLHPCRSSHPFNSFNPRSVFPCFFLFLPSLLGEGSGERLLCKGVSRLLSLPPFMQRPEACPPQAQIRSAPATARTWLVGAKHSQPRAFLCAGQINQMNQINRIILQLAAQCARSRGCPSPCWHRPPNRNTGCTRTAKFSHRA